MEFTVLTSSNQPRTNQPRTKRKLTKEDRQSILNELFKCSTEGSLKRGSPAMIAAEFSICVKTVLLIWKQAKDNSFNRTIDVSNRVMRRVGRKPIQLDSSKVAAIPLHKRTNIRSMAAALDMPKSTLHRRIKEKKIRAHSNAIKPLLTEENKRSRLEFCLSMLEPSSVNGSNPKFKSMFDYIHIDEKWFFMSKQAQRYYLLPEESGPIRSCQSKKFIPKIMFLAAVARPRYDSLGNELFSGKIGIFPFIFKEPAKRKSKNRAAGTLETKPILSVTKEVSRECLIQSVLPAIREKWPCEGRRQPIFIQQDNARPHIKPNDAEFLQAACIDEFDIRLRFQPPNSPDLNVLDLGYFQSIQSLQHQQAPRTIDELVQAVENSFNNLTSESLNNVFLTLQGCMSEIMKVHGGHNYAIPHMGKKRLERQGNLPIQLEIERELVENVNNYLQQ